MTKVEFYKKCAKILEIEYEESAEVRKRTRWGPRTPGNGRFAGYGIIRMFSEDCIQVTLNYPERIQKVFKNENEVFELLESLKK